LGGTQPLEIRGLTTAFHTDEGSLRAVDDVSLVIPRGATVGVVGESGCGKSVTALSVMRLVPEPPGKLEAGEILFEGRDLMKLSEREMRGLRGNDIAMIFQEPMSSLNPVYRVGAQIGESLRLHRKMSKKDAEARAVQLLEAGGHPGPRAARARLPALSSAAACASAS
jgi:ABC-type dipeptide/oligopeptide/nickel transport system ATPase component